MLGHSEREILLTLGARIKSYRIRTNIQQSQLERISGVSVSTIVRIEQGEDTKVSNLIKVLKALGLTENVIDLVPPQQVDYSRLFREQKPRQRVGKRALRAKPQKAVWVWKEDEES